MKNFHLRMAGLLLPALFFVFLSLAQEVAWGPTLDAGKKNIFTTILGEDTKSFYVYMTVNGVEYLEAYSLDEKTRLFCQELDLGEMKGEVVDMEGVTFIRDHFVLFGSYYDPKSKEAVIYATTADAKKGKLSKEKKEIFSVPVEKKRREGSFVLFLSRDKSKILVAHTAYYKKQKQTKTRYKLLDADLNLLVEREDVTKSDEVNYTTGNYIIDNDGSIYFVKRMDKGNVYLVSYDANKDYEKWEEEIRMADLGLDLKSKITEVAFKINDDNDLLVTGYYNKTEKGIDGCFFMKVDGVSKEIVLKKVNEFDKAFMKEFLTEKQKRKGRQGEIKPYFVSKEMLIKEDGGVVQIGEYYFHTISTDGRGSQTGESYLYGDLLIVSYDKDGGMTWAKRIPKSQVFSYSVMYGCATGSFGCTFFSIPWDIPRSFSYAAALTQDKLYVIFNDNPVNDPEEGEERDAQPSPLVKLSKLNIVLFTVDLQNGDVEYKALTDAVDRDVALRPMVTYQKKQGDRLLLFGSKKKKFKFGEFVW